MMIIAGGGNEQDGQPGDLYYQVDRPDNYERAPDVPEPPLQGKGEKGSCKK